MKIIGRKLKINCGKLTNNKDHMTKTQEHVVAYQGTKKK